MEIRNLLKGVDPYQAKLEKAERDSGRAGRSSAGSASSKGDRVSVSNTARLHTEAMRAANEAPDVRREKVEALKAKVEAGEYTIDPHKVAAKIIEEERELFQQ